MSLFTQSETETMIEALSRKHIWSEEPVFCFTSDIDWASEAVLSRFLSLFNLDDISLTCFVTHDSPSIERAFLAGNIHRGIHPNFLSPSSHGNNYHEVIQTCMSFAPEARSYRSHRFFEVSDTAHLLKEKYGFRYGSNVCTNLQQGIQPFLHESGMIQLPVFMEDGTYLYSGMDLDIMRYQSWLESPGLKIISFHPMNVVFNTPYLSFMRGIKDSMSWESFQNLDDTFIQKQKNNAPGIGDSILRLVEWVFKTNKTVYSLDEIYRQATGG